MYRGLGWVMWKLTSESNEDPDITEPIDFVIVGSAKTGEDKEDAQSEHSEGDSEDSDESIEAIDDIDYQAEDPAQWFNIHQAPGILFPRVQRAPHRPYEKSWIYYVSKSNHEREEE